MNKKFKCALFVLLTIFVSNCDPGAKYYIRSKASDVLVEIRPSLESQYCPNYPDICSFAETHKINDIGKGSLYRLKKGEHAKMYAEIGFQASAAKFPFEFVKIIHENDTLILQGKEQILKKFIRDKNTNTYYLDL